MIVGGPLRLHQTSKLAERLEKGVESSSAEDLGFMLGLYLRHRVIDS